MTDETKKPVPLTEAEWSEAYAMGYTGLSDLLRNRNLIAPTLIERLEKATGDDKEMMVDVWFALGQPGSYARFLAMLYAEAYESAALTLVPEGYAWGVEVAPWLEADRDHRMYRAMIAGFAGDAPTPALAFCIALLRARAQQGEEA